MQQIKITNGKGSAAIDEEAVIRYGLTGLALMENAGSAAAGLASLISPDGDIAIYAGRGRNGGDGLAAARHLALLERKVSVLLLADTIASLHPDTATNLIALGGFSESGLVSVSRAASSADVAAFAQRALSAKLVIDAVLGTGSSGAPRGLALDAVRAINSSGAKVLSLDLPSGCPADAADVPAEAVKADATLAFAALKEGLVSGMGAAYAGRLHLCRIGVPEAVTDPIPGELLDIILAAGLMPERAPWAHKKQMGKVAVIAGSARMPGAAMLAAKGAARAGAGIVELWLPEEVYGSVLSADFAPEVMLRQLHSSEGSFTGELTAEAETGLQDMDAVVIGPGMGKSDGARILLEKILGLYRGKLVLDADALNLLSRKPDIAEGIGGRLIITPHEGEMERLMPAMASSSRTARALQAASRYNAVTVLKGPGTVVAEPGGRYRVVFAGNSLMASPGTGDVLAGAVAAMAARCDNLYDAASAAAFMHSLAADIRKAEGLGALPAGDLADTMPRAQGLIERTRDEKWVRPTGSRIVEIRRVK